MTCVEGRPRDGKWLSCAEPGMERRPSQTLECEG